IATSPATAPLAAPSIVGLPRVIHSVIVQANVAAALAPSVATNADAARPSAAKALPALKPNHPTHRSAAPITLKGRLCGGICSLPQPPRLPNISAAANAEIPELMWPTVPPAKSSAPIPLIQPLPPHTQCASGL